MKTIRLFTSSPGDVAEERDKAEAVICSLDAYYAGRAQLVPVRWENLGLSADASFQEGVVRVLTAEGGVEIAIFIMWSRLGTPQGAWALRPDGQPYRSGTEQEFDLMLTARRESGGVRPHLLAYVRSDDKAYSAALAAAPVEQHSSIVTQRTLAEKFIRETFTDAATGQNLRAFHTYDQPVTFADRLRIHLRDVLDQLVGMEAGAVRWDEAPYRGLEVFDVDHEPIFRGREEQVCEILQRLRQCADSGCAFVVIVGASGSGKSSLARAGVAAHLLHFNLDETVRCWRCAVFTPGMADGALFAGLARSLASAGALPELCPQVDDLAVLASELENNPEGAVKLVLRPAFRAADATTGGPVRVLLVLDQFEELHTDRRISSEDREKFLNTLEVLARSGPIHILATLRSDFYGAAQRDETFLRLKGGQGHYDLLPPGAAALRLIITEPARLAGLRFESEEATGHTFEARLLDDALQQPDALPLLEYALRELYEQRSPEGLLTFAAYDAIGGIEGAIGRRAEAVFTSLPASVQAAFDDALWALITVDPDSESTPVRRRAPLPPPDDESPRATLLATLVRERFLTADRTGHQATISLAHEALLRSWPRVIEWLRENRDLLRIRRRVEESARLWTEKGRHPDYLLAPGLPLVEAESLLARRLKHFERVEGQVAVSFVEASSHAARHAERRRARLRATLTGLFAVLTLVALAAAGVALGKKKTADAALEKFQQQRQVADAANLKFREQFQLMNRSDHAVAETLFLIGNWSAGMAYLGRAIENDPKNAVAWQNLWSALVNGSGDRDQLPRHVLEHDGEVYDASFSADGRRVVTASEDKTARIWDVESGRPFYTELLHVAEVWQASFSADGRRVVTASEDKTAQIWDANGRRIGEPMRHETPVDSASFSGNGKSVVTTSEDNFARIWNAASGQLVGVPLQHEDRIMSARFSSDGSRVVTASRDNTARIWEAATGQAVGAPLRHKGTVYSASFSPDGMRVVTASQDGTAGIWDAASGQAFGPPLRHESDVRSASFSPDGTRVVTASRDSTAQIWEVATGQAVGAPLRHDALVSSASFSPDGTRVVTASQDGTVRVWDAASGQALGTPLRHDADVRSVIFSPDGTRVVTASRDKTARVWDACTGEVLRSALRHTAAVVCASFSPDGTRVVTASRDKTAQIWNANTRQAIGIPLRHDGEVQTASFSADGTRVVTASSDGTARVWDAKTGQPICAPLRHTNIVFSATFSPDGTRVVTASGATAQIWDATTGQPIGAPLIHDGYNVWSADFSADGRQVVTASLDKTARIWDAASGRPVGEPLRQDAPVWSASFSTDGTHIVTASRERTARVWDVSNGVRLMATMRPPDDAESLRADGAHDEKAAESRMRELASQGAQFSPPAYEYEIWTASFNPAGTRVVTASQDKTARIWDVASGQMVGLPLRHGARVVSASFSPDGARVVTASEDKTARVWDTASSQPVGGPLRHDNKVLSASFNADGTQVVTASADDTAQIWDVPSNRPIDLSALVRLIGAVAGLQCSEDGRLRKLTLVERLVRRKSLAEAELADPLWAETVRWLFAPPEQRPLHPRSDERYRNVADREIASGQEVAVRKVLNYDPGHPLVQIALASFETDERRADFLRRYGIARLPPEPKLWTRAAEMLLAQKEMPLAARAVEQISLLDPDFSETLPEQLKSLLNSTLPALPKKFKYTYTFEDPGDRNWTREGVQWVEKPPTGKPKVFTILKREEVEGRLGTVVTLDGQPEFQVFISDRDVSDPCIYFQSGNGKWSQLGKMENIE